MTRTADVAPEALATSLRDTMMGRMGQAHAIASVVHFLACEASSLITGATVKADAGFSCWWKDGSAAVRATRLQNIGSRE